MQSEKKIFFLLLLFGPLALISSVLILSNMFSSPGVLGIDDTNLSVVPDTYNVQSYELTEFDVLSNDSYPSVYEISIIEEPLNGIATVDGEKIKYLPKINTNNDSFVYEVCTGLGSIQDVNYEYEIKKSSIKFENASRSLGEDGGNETDTFNITANGDVESVNITTKSSNISESNVVLNVGDKYIDALGFEVIYLNNSGDNFKFSVSSVSNEHALSHIEFDFGKDATVISYQDGSVYDISRRINEKICNEAKVEINLSVSNLEEANPTESDNSNSECIMYGVNDIKARDSQLFSINFANDHLINLGPVYDEEDIEGIDFASDGSLVVVGGDNKNKDYGPVFRFNLDNNTLNLISRTGLRDLAGASFNNSESRLWIFAKNVGLISMNYNTPSDYIIEYPSHKEVEAIAWNSNGTTLYGAGEKNLYKYNYEENTFEVICNALFPGQTEALEYTNNGTLVGVTQYTGHDFQVFVIDPNSCATRIIKTYGYDLDVESVTFNNVCNFSQPSVTENPTEQPTVSVSELPNETATVNATLKPTQNVEITSTPEVLAFDEFTCENTISSDTSFIVEETGQNAMFVQTPVHSAWTANIPGAKWIWKSPIVENPTKNETYTFVKEFEWDGTGENIVMNVAADNSYRALLNGHLMLDDTDEFNYRLSGQDQFDIQSYLVIGVNKLEFEVKNWAGNSNPLSNPAGVLFSLTYPQNCDQGVYPTEIVTPIHTEVISEPNATNVVTQVPTEIVVKVPVISDDSFTITQNQAVSLNVLINDFSEDSSIVPSTLEILNQPVNGVISSFSDDYKVIYLPNVNHLGTDEFTYKVCDSNGLCGNAKVSINISRTNLNPVVVPDAFTVFKDTSREYTIFDNDSDQDGGLVFSSVKLISDPLNGVVQFDFDKKVVSYTPKQDYLGSDYFTYEICDNEGACGNALVSIEVVIENLPPIAVDDIKNAETGKSIIVDVLENDLDPEDTINPVSLSIVVPVQFGSAKVTDDSKIEYKTSLKVDGNDLLMYQVCDDVGQCDNANLSLEIRKIKSSNSGGGGNDDNNDDENVIVNISEDIGDDIQEDTVTDRREDSIDKIVESINESVGESIANIEPLENLAIISKDIEIKNIEEEIRKEESKITTTQDIVETAAVVVAATGSAGLTIGGIAAAAGGANPMGLMLGGHGMDTLEKIKLAKKLGAKFFKPGNIFLDKWPL